MYRIGRIFATNQCRKCLGVKEGGGGIVIWIACPVRYRSGVDKRFCPDKRNHSVTLASFRVAWMAFLAALILSHELHQNRMLKED